MDFVPRSLNSHFRSPLAMSNHRPTPRKRPKQLRSAETVSAIIEAAARILEASGREGMSTNAVAAKAGVSIGTLYQYFPNKEAIVGALLHRETEQFLSRVESAVMQSSAQEAMAVWVDAAIEHQFGRPRLARNLDFEEAGLPFDEATQNVSRRAADAVFRILGRFNLLSEKDLQVGARDIVAITKSIIDNAGVNGELDHAALANRVRRSISGYLGLTAQHEYSHD